MKHQTFRIAAALLLALPFSACSLKTSLDEAVPDIRPYQEFYAAIEQSHPQEAATRVYADASLDLRWNAADEIAVFNASSGMQKFRFNGATGDAAGSFSFVSGSAAGSAVPAIYAVYPYACASGIDTEGILSVTLPATQTWADRTFAPGSDVLVAAGTDNNLAFKNTSGVLVLKIYGSGNIASVTLAGNNGEKLAGTATVSMPVGGIPALTMAAEAATSVLLHCATPVTLAAEAENYKEFWFVLPPTTFSGGFTVTVTNTAGAYAVQSTTNAYAIERSAILRMEPFEVSFSSPATPEAVDLGLSVNWATFNVGANAPEEYGDYFAWGETEPYYQPGYAQSESPVWRKGKSAGYDWPSYKWCMGTGKTLTKYCANTSCGYNGFTDNKPVLESADDAARANWGGLWRMPTEAQVEELRDASNCSWVWETLNGINGYRITSLKPGYSSKSIFLPAAGIRVNDVLNNLNNYGYYWTSTANSEFFSYLQSFKPTYIDKIATVGTRIYGCPVRPVCPK